MSDLLPCPFCGGKADIDYDGSVYDGTHVYCTECDIRTESYKTKTGSTWDVDAAIAAWNRRALPAAQPDAAAIREAALREAADVDWASGLEIRDDAPDYLSEWQRGFVSGCTAFRNAILALKGETP